MKITILNGATATGKSTAFCRLGDLLPGRIAVLDGDEVGRCNLREAAMSPAFLNVFQDNILACAKNFQSLHLDHLVIAFVFPEQERVDRLNRIFQDNGLCLNWMSLVLDDARYRERIGEPKQGQDRTIFEKSVVRNQQIAQLAEDNGFPCVDASELSVDEMCRRIVDVIETSNKMPGHVP